MNLLSGENKLEIIMMLLFQIGFGIKFNIVGEISLSDILVIAYFFLFYFRDPVRKEVEMRFLELSYFSLILVQCFMEFLVGNSFSNAVKGIAITFVSLCHFYFLLKVLYNRHHLIVWAFIGLLIYKLLFSPFKRGRILDALTANDPVFMKFVIATLIIDIALIIALQISKKAGSQMFVLIGAYLIVCGARSSGMLCILTGIITLAMTYGIERNLRSLIRPSIVVLLLSYGGYCVYVNQVLSGAINAGNNDQIRKIENPYNPMYLLMAGRTETFVGWVAFTDNPITGWGSWKKDSELGNKYHKLQSKYGGDKIERKEYRDDFEGSDVIPCHSVIVSYACFNGVFALIFVCIILFSCLKYGIKSIGRNDEHDVLLVYLIVFMCWHMIFSPQSHFRHTIPLSMAFMVACYWKMKSDEEGTDDVDDNEQVLEKI